LLIIKDKFAPVLKVLAVKGSERKFPHIIHPDT